MVSQIVDGLNILRWLCWSSALYWWIAIQP